MMSKFKKKPETVTVEAEQYFPNVKPWPLGLVPVPLAAYAQIEAHAYGWAPEACAFLSLVGGVFGQFLVCPGDWIVWETPQQHPRVWKDKDFRAAYEPVEDGKAVKS